MYQHEGLSDILFLMLYGGAALMAMLAALYLLLTRGNAFSSHITPPASLRRWAAAFMLSVAASHAWWYVLGLHWLTDDRLVRNIVAITLDRLTFVPLMMAVLLRMLQDRRRPLWPIGVAMLPFAAIAIVCIVGHNSAFERFTESYSLVLALTFLIYYVRALRQYDRWLRQNYSDLQHKEVWQSLVLLAIILIVYIAYTSNEGALATEYFAQVNTLIIVGFVIWRVETLQELSETSVPETEGPKLNYTPPIFMTISVSCFIGAARKVIYICNTTSPCSNWLQP